MALALQWSLDKTANSGLSLSRGLIAAATSDNVEPLAVVACEKFGTTLSICRDTCAKVERLVEPRKPILTFLGAYIGYSANDCAAQLVQSVAGVQFFALASALVSSIGEHQGAKALEILLEQSAVDKTQVPPAGKLQPLLKALEPRCSSLQFLDSVVYCKNLLVQCAKSAESKTFWKKATQYPDADGIAQLLLALSQLKRSGLRSRLELRAARSVPWVIAFISWVLGFFPSVAFDHGQSLLESVQNSRLKVQAVEILSEDLEISFPSDLERPSDLIVCQVSKMSWSGMVGVKAYRQSLRDEYDLSSDDAIRCLTDILPYAIHQCLTLLRPSHVAPRGLDISLDQSTSSGDNHFTIDGSLSSLSANPFGQNANICKAISLIFGLSLEGPPISIKPLADDMNFHDLPALQNHLAALKENCGCARCNQTEGRVRKTFQQCLEGIFWRGLACVVTDILCLSFFENLDELAVSLHHDRESRTEVSSGVFDILTRGGHQAYSVVKFYDWAFALVGYSVMLGVKSPRYAPRRILSSVKGQVTYLKLFETRQIARRGYMTFSWAHGVLRYQDVEYPGAVIPSVTFPSFVTVRAIETSPMSETFSELVKSPRNLCWGYSMEWVTTPRTGILDLVAFCDVTPVHPLAILENLSQSYIMEGCEHRSDTPLDQPDADARHTAPLFNHRNLSPQDLTSITCAAVAGDNGLRLLTFGSQAPPFRMVFRGSAYLSCALDVCRRANSRLLIL